MNKIKWNWSRSNGVAFNEISIGSFFTFASDFDDPDIEHPGLYFKINTNDAFDMSNRCIIEQWSHGGVVELNSEIYIEGLTNG